MVLVSSSLPESPSTQRTMIDLGRMKNCLNCSHFTLMLNSVAQGGTGKLLEEKLNHFCAAYKKCPWFYPNAPFVQFTASARKHTCNSIFVLQSLYVPQLLLFSTVHPFIHSLCHLNHLLRPPPPPQPLHFHLIVFFSLSLSLSRIPRSAPVSRLAGTGEGTTVIKVPARSHQFTLSLTDPCAAQYITKREEGGGGGALGPPMCSGPFKTKCNNKELCSLCQLNEPIHAKGGEKRKVPN